MPSAAPVPTPEGAGDLSISPAGPWEHRRVTANGASFHIAQMGPDRSDHAVVLLHGFPLFWWQWRDVMPLLAEGGLRVIAMDLRGFGDSDLQHDEPDLADLARDVNGVAAALGLRTFTTVGVGMGGTVAWMLGAMGSVRLRSVVAVSAPHPLNRRMIPRRLNTAAALNGRLTIPFHRVRILENGKYLRKRVSAMAAPDHRAALLADVPRYQAALNRPFAADKAVDSWTATRFPTVESRRILESRVTVPVVSVRGADDPLFTADDFSRDAEHCAQGMEQHVIPDAGFFLPREAPDRLAGIIADHVSALPPETD